MHQRALVVEGPGRVVAPHPGGRGGVGRAVAGLVAEGPHDDARVVVVAPHHPLDPFDDRRAEAGIVHQRALPCVRLDVRLVDQVEPELVAQLGEVLVVGVVRGAHGVEVVRLHEQQVGPRELGTRSATALRVVLVQVDAVDQHGHAVDQQLVVAHLDRAEPGVARGHLDDPTVGVCQRGQHAVALWRLVRPRFDAGDLEARPHDARLDEHARDQLRRFARGVPGGHVERTGGREPSPPQRLDDDLGGPAGLASQRTVRDNLDLQRARRRAVEAGQQLHPFEVRRRRRVPRDAALDAAVPPLVLVLEPRGRRPLRHDECQGAAPTGTDVLGDVELVRQPRVGAGADEASVDPHLQQRLRGTDAQHDAPALPLLRHRDGAAVDPGGVVLGHRRRLEIERHDDVRVVRPVLRAGGLQGPGPGHVDGVPARVVGRRVEHLAGQRVRAVEQLEAPRAVQARPPR